MLVPLLMCALGQLPSPQYAQPQPRPSYQAVQAVSTPAVQKSHTWTLGPGPLRQCLARAAYGLANPKTHTWTLTHTVSRQTIAPAAPVAGQVVMVSTFQPAPPPPPPPQVAVYYQLVPVASPQPVYAAPQAPQGRPAPQAAVDEGAGPPPSVPVPVPTPSPSPDRPPFAPGVRPRPSSST